MAVTDKTLLILDDDAPLRGRLRRAMEVRGFDVMDAGTVQDGVEMVRKTPPAYAILDMKLEDGTGLTLVQELRKKRAGCRIVMLTGFGNIATAVAARERARAPWVLGLWALMIISVMGVVRAMTNLSCLFIATPLTRRAGSLCSPIRLSLMCARRGGVCLLLAL